AYVTFQIGCKIGENSLDRWIPERRLKSIEKKFKDQGAIALALPALMPPPFPLTPFVLACGALKVRRTKFFLTLGAARLLRFTVVATLALLYGRRIITIINSGPFKVVMAVFILTAILGTGYSAYKLIRATKTHATKVSQRGASGLETAR